MRFENLRVFSDEESIDIDISVILCGQADVMFDDRPRQLTSTRILPDYLHLFNYQWLHKVF